MQRCKTAGCGYAAPRTEYRVKQTKKNGTKVYYPYCEPCRQAMAKRQREDKKRKKMDEDRSCSCGSTASLLPDRNECKECYQRKRTENNHRLAEDRAEVPIPEGWKCTGCGCSSDERRPQKHDNGLWRNRCVKCVNLSSNTGVPRFAQRRIENMSPGAAPNTISQSRHASASAELRSIAKGAKERGIGFDESPAARERMLQMLSEPCDYCGFCPGPGDRVRLDRVNSAGIYTPPNLVPCCTACNLAKNSANKETWLTELHLYARTNPIPAEMMPMERVVASFRTRGHSIDAAFFRYRKTCHVHHVLNHQKSI